ncbi:Guanine nucleotide-binding-like protein 1 [Homalodisca vitripennis]|nr:Guanine nucleotide-binding-like protein 1 [Homalodisca vitripennis]
MNLEDDSDDEKVEIEDTVTVKKSDTSYELHEKFKGGMLTIGCVGQPNVGKSSLMNAIMGKKVVSVSRTPGHTKHFQTIHLTTNVRLCDCPGLVFPSKVPKTLQVLMGSYPIAQLREPFSSVQYLAERVDLVHLLRIIHPESDTTWSAMDICDEPELSIIEPNPENTEVSFSKSPDCLYTSIKELENSLSENNFLYNLENNDEKLKIAGKIGAALLEENNLLRGKNIELEAKLEILEEQLDRMKIEENKYLSKIEDLLQNLSETQVQLGKEKKLRLDIQIIFEEHDYKQGQLVDDYAKMINHLQNTINKLEKKVSSQDTKILELPTFTNNETETETVSHCISQPINCSSNMQMKLVQLKVRQDSLECTVKDLAVSKITNLRNLLTQKFKA